MCSIMVPQQNLRLAHYLTLRSEYLHVPIYLHIYTYLHISTHIYTYLQVTWADVLDFYIRLDQERSKATVFQPLHHDGDFKAAQHSRCPDRAEQ